MFFLAELIVGKTFGFDFNLVEGYFLFLTYSVGISFPCLFLGWLSLYIIVITPYTDTAKFLLWIITAPALVLFEFIIILSMFDFIGKEIILFSLPGIAATGVAIGIRYPQFRKLIYTPKIENHETNLV
jgi:hypothetical protein